MQDVHPLNLFRINWRNDSESGGIGEINYLEIPKDITGVEARIIGLVGKFFPTGAHKVGATYGCLAPYLVTGRFNPEYHKAVWPSTGNYCRGGTFNSALLSVHPVAILPEEMSKERFDWLKNLGAEIFIGHSSENVKSIVDKVVYTSAVHGDNPEIQRAKELNIKTIRRAELLAEVVNDKFLIAVSGTHGKNCTGFG